MKPFALFVSIVFAAVFYGTSLIAQGETVTHTFSLPLTTTNWSDSVSVPKFDASLGTLDSVYFELGGGVQGTGEFESLDAAPATVLMNLQALLTLNRPDNTIIVQTLPVFSTSDDVAAYDGTTDFGGTSGKTYADVTSTDLDSFISSATSDKSLFTGTGNITLPVTSAGTSYGSGAGNLIVQFSTSASASVLVKYNYTPVPEPSTLALLSAAGMVVFAAFR